MNDEVVDLITNADAIEGLQTRLVAAGYKIEIDGILGPDTQQALDDYQRRLAEMPLPPKPWWASRAMWGSLMTLLSVPAAIAGYGFDAGQATDAIMPIVEQLPILMAAIGGLLAWWGRRDAKQPIDTHLFARVRGRELRIPKRVRHTDETYDLLAGLNRPGPATGDIRPQNHDPFGNFRSD